MMVMMMMLMMSLLHRWTYLSVAKKALCTLEPLLPSLTATRHKAADDDVPSAGSAPKFAFFLARLLYVCIHRCVEYKKGNKIDKK